MKIRFIILICLAALLILVLSFYNLSKVATQMSDENLYSNRENGVIFTQITPGGVSEMAGILRRAME